MLSSPESNLKFTDEQNRQLEMFHSQLNNLQAEISMAQKNIKNLKDETIRTLSEKKFLEAQLIPLQQELERLIFERTNTSELIETNRRELEKHKVNHQMMADAQLEREEKINSREKEVQKIEVMQDEKQKELFTKNAALIADRLAVQKAQEAFKEALASVSWSI